MALNEISQLKILVTGTARNVEKTIRSDLARISRALSGVASVHWLVVESDSSDNTIASLETLSQEWANFSFISLGRLENRHPERTDRLAECRNVYLQELRTNSRYRHCDLLVVADLDGVNTTLSRHSFETSFRETGWDACFANQLGPYYDIWALRHGTWSPNDCWELFRFLDQFNFRRSKSLYDAVVSRMVRIPPKNPWIRVESAFGGLGIYWTSAISTGSYVGRAPDGSVQSEHVAFHQEMVSRGRGLFINPGLINARLTEHSRHATLFGRIRALALDVDRRLPSRLRLRRGGTLW